MRVANSAHFCLHPTHRQQFPYVLCWGWGLLPFTGSFTATRETHSRATANFILPVACTDSAIDQTIVNSLSHTHPNSNTQAHAVQAASLQRPNRTFGWAPTLRSGGSLAALRNTAGDTSTWCVFTHACAVIVLALALLIRMALHVFVCVRACVCAVVESPERRRSEGGTEREGVGLAGQMITAAK